MRTLADFESRRHTTDPGISQGRALTAAVRGDTEMMEIQIGEPIKATQEPLLQHHVSETTRLDTHNQR